MITTKEELKEYISADNSWYKKGSGKSSVIERISSENNRILKKYLVFLRKSEYHNTVYYKYVDILNKCISPSK